MVLDQKVKTITKQKSQIKNLYLTWESNPGPLAQQSIALPFDN